MTKRKMVTQTEIIRAIRKEPLVRNEFVLMDAIIGKVSEDKKCGVCAVGAVLRSAGFENKAILRFGRRMLSAASCSYDSNIFHNGVKIKTLLEERRYLHALSVKFETQALKTGMGVRTRKVLIEFVRENFPKRVKLDSKF